MKTYRKDGKIILEIPEETVLDAATFFPEGAGLRVINKERFLNFFTENLEVCGETDEESPHILRLFHQVISEAYEQGYGLEESQNYN